MTTYNYALKLHIRSQGDEAGPVDKTGKEVALACGQWLGQRKLNSASHFRRDEDDRFMYV